MRIFLRSLAIPLFAIVLASTGAPTRAGEFRPSPPMKGRVLPTPPRQTDAWTAPQNTLPARLVTATETLFQLGLADPRGCEYRVIEVGTGSCWTGDHGVVTTHGWVLPEQPNMVERYAVCWNGLVHPLVSVGDKADVRADVDAMFAPEPEPIDAEAHYFRMRTHEEAVQIAHDIPKSLKICLLLRLGHADLAQRLQSKDATVDSSLRQNQTEPDDPFLRLAQSYAWNLFNRAVGAHMRRDDRLALASARLLGPLQTALETANKKRQGASSLQIEFLDSVPDFLADQERRAKEAAAETAPRDPVAQPEPAKRIAALIRDLENVNARQQGQPGGVRLAEDPRVVALIEAGDAAVDPLITCLETDTRLTRSVHFWRDFEHDRTIITVYEAAFTALENILDATFFQIGSTGDALSAREPVFRKYTADKVRRYWSKYGNRPAAERWYAMLKDDDAASALWVEAANNIVQSTNFKMSRGTMYFTDRVEIVPDTLRERPAAMRGAALRDDRSPSVSALIDRAARQLIDREPANQLDNPESDALQLALILRTWDKPAGAALIKQLLQRCVDRAADRPADTMTVVSLTLALAPLDEEAALQAYAACFRTWEPLAISYRPGRLVEPLWRYPQSAQAKELVDWILKATRYRSQADTIDYLPYFVTTPLITLPEVRQRIVESLGNKSLVERTAFECKDDIKIGDFVLRAPEGKPPIRLCDFYALQLSQVSGLPAFQVSWPVEQRDAAVAATATFIKQYGPRFALLVDDPNRDPFNDNRPTVQLMFPALEHPATLADVQQGLAIFSFGDGREVRQWKLPKRPLEARRVEANSTSPPDFVGGRYDRSEDHFLVWQAEEVRTEHGWNRFYGVVERSGLARIPATEIEFIGDSRWNLSRGLDAKIVPPPKAKRRQLHTPEEQLLSDPFVVQLKLRNRRGVAQDVPTEYLRKSDAGPLLIPGVTLKLSYSNNEEQRAAWKPLAAKPHGRLQPGTATRTLDAYEEFVALEVDLRDWFEISQPGSYVLEIQFTSTEGGFADGDAKMLVVLK